MEDGADACAASAGAQGGVVGPALDTAGIEVDPDPDNHDDHCLSLAGGRILSMRSSGVRKMSMAKA